MAMTLGQFYPVNIYASSSDVERILDFVTDYDRKHEKVNVSMDGAYFSGQKLVGQLVGILVISLPVALLYSGSSVESLVQPTIILSEMIIDVLFVILCLWAMETLNIMSMIGLIVMGGIVINDSILKIDTINSRRKAGMPLIKAILTAGHERLLPIVMTSLTTIFCLAAIPFERQYR